MLASINTHRLSCACLIAFFTGAISIVVARRPLQKAKIQFHHQLGNKHRRSQNNSVYHRENHWSLSSFPVVQVQQTTPFWSGGTSKNKRISRANKLFGSSTSGCFCCVPPATTSSNCVSGRNTRISNEAGASFFKTKHNLHDRLASKITRMNLNNLCNGGGDDDADADARGYHHIVSNSVDITNGYVRNGILTVNRSVRDIDGNKRRTFVYTIPTTTSIGALEDSAAAPLPLPPPYERSSNIKHVVPSPSGDKVAIFMDEEDLDNRKKATILEIWTNQGTCLQTRIVLPTNSKRHEQVLYNNSRFGGVSWHPKETALVYVAERKLPYDAKSFFDTSTTTTEQQDVVVKKGGQYTLDVGLKEDFGEKFVGVSIPGLFVVATETGVVDSVENVPSDTVLGQPVFDPLEGNTIVYTAWEVPKGQRRLGSVYCYQRPSKLYVSSVQELLGRINKKNTTEASTDTPPTKKEELPESFCICLTPQDSIVRSPRFSLPLNDGSSAKLAFLYNTNGFDTHDGVVGLATMNWSSRNSIATADHIQSTIVSTRRNLIEPIVQDVPVSKANNLSFPGLFLDQLSQDCFTSNGSVIVVETKWACQSRVLLVATKDGTMTPLPQSQTNQSATSQSMLCLQRCRRQNNNNDDDDDDILFCTESSPTRPPTIHRVSLKGIVADEGKSSQAVYTFQPISISRLPPSYSSSGGGSSRSVGSSSFDNQMEYDIVTLPADNSIIQGILLRPKTKDTNTERPLPLIVVPHGGPHSCFVTQFLPTYTYLCLSGGYAVCLVNYRGSTGYGQHALESLVGNAGTQDVVDLVELTNHILNHYKDVIDSNRVGICGGSHGGYLAGHCIGQYPELFKVAVMRNPVTNIASMVSSTDIPDWCYVESIGNYDFNNFRPPTAEQLVRMHEASPIAHIDNVVAPTLIALGLEDKRVPPISQGMEYFYALRSKNGSEKTKLLLYDKNDHAIDQPREEADHWINIKQWFDQHL